MNVCGRCEQQWFGAHFCPAANAGPVLPPGAFIPRQLTEADVRRIVREELAKAAPKPAVDLLPDPLWRSPMTAGDTTSTTGGAHG